MRVMEVWSGRMMPVSGSREELLGSAGFGEGLPEELLVGGEAG